MVMGNFKFCSPEEAVSFAITYIGLNKSHLICPIMKALGQ
jgi:hypothetical protein